MAEIQTPETNGGGGQQFLVGPSETVGTKRQRRPSVRLGEIGGDDLRRSNKQQQQQWRLPPPIENHRNSMNKSSSSSKTRPLVNLSSGGGDGFHETLERDERDGGGNLDSVAIGSWKVKDAKKRASSKRLRSNWVSAKIDEGGGGAEKFSGGEDGEDGYREFRVEDSESPLKEQSPIQSSENLDNLGVDGLYHGGSRRHSRVRVSDHPGMELSGPSETDAREWNGTSGDRNNGNEGGRDGVRVWLNGLGLSRYAPVFEIHEVDDEVLAMLTLEDLKDMGINAVGSRRKMYCAIQKLGKGFS